jgi:hypothetical protein
MDEKVKKGYINGILRNLDEAKASIVELEDQILDLRSDYAYVKRLRDEAIGDKEDAEAEVKELEAANAELRGVRDMSTAKKARAIVDSYCADGVDAHEDERNRLTVFIEQAMVADRAALRARLESAVELTPYQRANLRWALEVIGYPYGNENARPCAASLNTGDWVGEIHQLLVHSTKEPAPNGFSVDPGMEDLRARLGAITDWTHAHGKHLCPPMGTVDSYGEGMRNAKRQVAAFLAQRAADGGEGA